MALCDKKLDDKKSSIGVELHDVLHENAKLHQQLFVETTKLRSLMAGWGVFHLERCFNNLVYNLELKRIKSSCTEASRHLPLRTKQILYFLSER